MSLQSPRLRSEVRYLFYELADLSPGERDRIFRERQTEPNLRIEVESLLSFDSTDVQDLTDCIANAAQDLLRSVLYSI